MADDEEETPNSERRSIIAAIAGTGAAILGLGQVAKIQEAENASRLAPATPAMAPGIRAEKPTLASQVIHEELTKKLRAAMEAGGKTNEIVALLRQAQNANCLDEVLTHLETATEVASLDKGPAR